MATPDPKSAWQQHLENATAQAEQDLRRAIAYINDEVVPDLRRNGVEVLRAAAVELHSLASRLDDRARSAPPRPSSPPPRDEPGQ